MKPPDEPICVELSMVEGLCVHPISSRKFYWNEKNKYLGRTWWEQRPAMIQVPAPTWAANKAFIIKNCKNTKNCDAHVTSWDRTLNILDTEVKKKSP